MGLGLDSWERIVRRKQSFLLIQTVLILIKGDLGKDINGPKVLTSAVSCVFNSLMESSKGGYWRGSLLPKELQKEYLSQTRIWEVSCGELGFWPLDAHDRPYFMSLRMVGFMETCCG